MPKMTFNEHNQDLELTILSAQDVETVLSNLDLEEALKSQSEVFKSFSKSKNDPNPSAGAKIAPASQASIQTPHRVTLSSEDVTTLFMPSRVAGAGGMACKIVSVPKNGGSDGLPASTIVMDETTGQIRALINARKLTALRNACGSALSLRASPPSRPPTNLLIFGSGGQASAHAQVFLKLFPTLTVCTFVVRKATSRSNQLVSSIQKSYPNVEVTLGVSMYPTENDEPAASTPATTAASAAIGEQDLKFNLPQTVHNANIIITVTPSLTPLFRYVDVTSQTHLILVGSYKPEMKEVDVELIHRAGLVVVDSKDACLVEAGELMSAGTTREGMVELGELLDDVESRETTPASTDAGLADKIKESGDITLFKSVGLGIQDVAIAHLVLREAEKLGLGTLVPDYD